MPETGIVLLVEDNPKILDLNRRMLEREGCVILTAKTLAEARSRLKIANPDVAVLDVMLPDGSGLDFLAELREASNAPALFLTAKSDREDILAGLRAGGNDYITKPYDIDEFRMRVKGFLSLSGAARQKNTARQNGVHLPDKLREKLERINAFPLTTVVAPAGYGKTTAARAFVSELPPECKVYRLSVLSENASDFWGELSELFAADLSSLSEDAEARDIPADAAAKRNLSRLVNEARKRGGKAAYLLIDDFHLIPDQGINDFLLLFARRLPERVHIVILSRTPVFAQDERFSLHGQINEITERDFCYGPKETKTYFALGGCPIGDEEASRLSAATEGWISALYLNLKSYSETGRFSDEEDIHGLMDATLFRPLPEREKELLAALSLFPAFSGTHAAFVSETDGAEDILRRLAESNRFITRQEADGTFRLHPLFRGVLGKAFAALPEERRRRYTRRAGLAYLEKREFISARRMFFDAGDFENLLLSLEADRGASLNGEHKAELTAWSRGCPDDILRGRPAAILIFARLMFMYDMKAECGEKLETLKRVLAEDTRLSARERGDLLGEAEIAAGLLEYNDIEAMSARHRRACELTDGPARSLSPLAPWTFGSPSVFAAYHRKAGGADGENKSMAEAMPYWYRLNQNHGSGAEHLFEGELHYLRGNFTDSIISLHRALRDARRDDQPVMALAADFLRLRIEAFQGGLRSPEPALSVMRGYAESARLPMLRHTADICETWLYTLSGQPDKAAGWIADDDLSATRLLFPAVHFPHMVYCQLLLARGEYAALIAREEDERALYKSFSNLLPEIYLDIQLAASYESLGRRKSAARHLVRALESAAPDKIYMPFVENGGVIIEPLREIPGGVWDSHVEKILALYLQNQMGKPMAGAAIRGAGAAETLTERDMAIVGLLADGKSNKEIAAETFLSESYVKTLLKRLYQKLGITDEKDKRSILALMLESK